MAAVVDALRQEHRNIGRLLEALEHQIGVFADGDAPDYDIIVGVADYFLDYPDRCHHPKEDAIAAALAARHPAEMQAVGDLAGEHSALHQRAQRFRQTVGVLLNDADIARAEVVDAARRFIDAERAHMRKEDAVFLPLAERLLSDADWRDIEGELGQRRDPVFGDRVEGGFRALSERLLAWEAESGSSSPS